MITPTQLIAATGCTAANAERFAVPLAEAMEIAHVETPLRMAHFISQTAHECMLFAALSERANPGHVPGAQYEGSKRLGNTQPGDGARFCGRGVIQLTGRDNYGEFRVWLKTKCGIDADLLAHPELVATDPKLACLAAAWYWMSRGINRFADADDCLAVSIAINGKGTNGLPNHFEERKALLARAKRAMGLVS